MLTAHFDELLGALVAACQRQYGPRLVSVAVFGSVGRGTPRPDSDVDGLIVAEGLPRGRVARVAEFAGIEAELAEVFERLRRVGVTTVLSPVLKTPAEVEQGSPLFLDMLDDARILVDLTVSSPTPLRSSGRDWQDLAHAGSGGGMPGSGI